MSGAPISTATQAALDQLSGISTIEGLKGLANSLSASASGPNAILYSQDITLASGVVASSNDVAQSLAAQTGYSIVNNTDRAQFLSNDQVFEHAVNIFGNNGFSEGDALAQARILFGYGNNLTDAQLNASSIRFLGVKERQQ
jgi:hypothetical protein